MDPLSKRVALSSVATGSVSCALPDYSLEQHE
jgi:hypothetical protein